MERPELFYTDGIGWSAFPSGATGGNATEPLVILHGLFGSSDNWHTYGRALSDTRDVLIPDIPNHGGSCHIDSMDYRDLAALLWDAVEQTGYGNEGHPVSILGHSMGGKVAMAMAISRPSAVSRLIVADIAPVVYPRRHDDIFDAMRNVEAAQVRNRSDGDRVMARSVPEKAIRMFLLKSLVPDSNTDEGEAGGVRYRWSLNVAGLAASYDEIRGWPYTDQSYDGTALAIAGGESSYVDTAAEEALRRHLPSVRIETIPGVGHWIHVEAREEFLALVRRELE